VVFAGSSGSLAQDNANFFWNNSNNRLGIGTASPRETLDIAGKVRINTPQNSDTLNVRGASDGQYFRVLDNDAGAGIADKDWTNTLTFSNKRTYNEIYSNAGTPIGFQVSNGGYVGIGTTAPATTLDVRGIITLSGLSDGLSVIQTEGNRHLTLISTGASGAVRFYTENGGSAAERMRVNANGNVGIGTTAPSEKLEVNGSLLLASSGAGWIKGNDANHSIYFREGAIDVTNYYEYGGTLSAGKGHRFLTGGVQTSQQLRMQIANDGIYMNSYLGIGTSASSDLSCGIWLRLGMGENVGRICIFKDLFRRYSWQT